MQTKVQQLGLLLSQHVHFALNAADVVPRGTLLLDGPFADFARKPIAHRVLLFHAGEQGQHLLVDLPAGQPDAGMIAAVVHRAAVIDVFLARRFFDHALARHLAATMAAADDAAGVEQVVGLVNAVAKQSLYAVERRAVYDRLVGAGVPLVHVPEVANVAAVAEDVVDLAPRPRRLLGQIADAVFLQPPADHVQRVPFEGVEPEDQLHVLRGQRFDFDDAAAVDAIVRVAVRRQADEQPRLRPLGQAVFDVERLLLGVEGRHRGQHTPLHATSRRVLRRLADRDQLNLVIAFQPLEFAVVEEIAGRAVDLVDQKAVDLVGVVFGVRQHFLEDLPLGRLARRLGHAEQLDDLPALTLGVLGQRFDLHVQAEALAFLLPTADAGHRDVPARFCDRPTDQAFCKQHRSLATVAMTERCQLRSQRNRSRLTDLIVNAQTK